MHGRRAELYLHLVWATWDRTPLLTAEMRPVVYRCIQKECAGLGVELHAIGGTEDHVHLLVRIPTTLTVARLVQQLKGSSSHLATSQGEGGTTFKWQGGYGAFTVSPRNVRLVRDYIVRQEEHHRDRTFRRAYEPPFVES